MDWNGILKGHRLKLRAVEPEDATPMWEMECDTQQWRYNGMTAPFSLFNLREYANTYEADPYTAGQIRLIAELIDNDSDIETEERIIGMVDLYDISSLNRTAFIGLYVRPMYRNCGYGEEMEELIETYAYNILNIRILGAKVVSGNESSRTIFSHAGFEEAARLKRWVEISGEYHDLYIYLKENDRLYCR